jgi:hypothetical protein
VVLSTDEAVGNGFFLEMKVLVFGQDKQFGGWDKPFGQRSPILLL